jgi:hypothetical protein
MNAEAAPGLRRVAHGLGYVFGGVALHVLIWSAVLSLPAFFAAPPPWLILTLLAVFILAMALHLTGQLLCLGTPAESEARGPLLMSIALNVLGKAAAVVAVLGALLGWWPRTGPLFNLTAAAPLLLGVASLTAFLICLRRLARYLDYGEGELHAEAVLVWWVLTLTLWLVVQGLALAFLSQYSSLNVLSGFTNPDLLALLLALLFLAFGVLFVVVSVLVLIRYCNLLIDLRNTIWRQLDTLAEELRVKGHGLRPS